MNKVVTIAFSTFFACSIFATDKASFVIENVKKSSGKNIDTIAEAVSWLQKSKNAKRN